MAIMQPQKRPRGIAFDLAIKIGATIDRENKKRGHRITVTQILRALEWTRYQLTEGVLEVSGPIANPDPLPPKANA